MQCCSIVADGMVLVVGARVAGSPWERARGMIGRTFGDTLPALVLEPCSAVHTFGMRFPIDVVFYDRDRRIVRIVDKLRPLRGASCAAARGAIETPAGRARSLGFAEGRRIRIEPV